MTPAYAADLVLDRHAQRRAAGIATVSVLLGPTHTAGVDTFARWTTRAGRSLVRVADGIGTADLLEACVEALGRPVGVRVAAIAWLAEASGEPADTLARRLGAETPSARQMLLDVLVAGRYAPSARLCLAMLGGRTEDPDALPSPGDLFPDEPDPALAMLDALHGLCPTRAPAVLLVSDRPDTSVLQENMRLLAALAERMVACVTAWALSEQDWDTAAAEVADSRFKAICREGLIRLRDPAVDDGRDREVADLLDWARQRGFGEPVPTRLRAMLAAHRRSLAARPADRSRAPGAQTGSVPGGRKPRQHSDGTDPHAFARSQAEATLYAVLRQWPPTAGQVRLNARLPIPFGAGDMEVDLLLVVDRVAIELDGYYHFLTVEGYRRDRRKDFLLQTHGQIVLRFHADEIASRAGLDEILTRIGAAITCQRGRTGSIT